MKKICYIVLVASITLLSACGQFYNCKYFARDYLSKEQEDNVEFYVMKVKEDYLQIPGRTEFVYESESGKYPELQDGQIALITADVTIKTGGETGYSGNYFIDELKSSTILDYAEVVDILDIPDAREQSFGYDNHILKYQSEDRYYLLVLYRGYIEVYLNGSKYLEYGTIGLENDELLDQFWTEL